VLVSARDGGSERVTLTDDTGTSALATVAHGVEVEILAWRPRRGGDTRYRVVCTSGGIEGWLSATNLQARRPPPPKVVVPAAPSRRPVLPAPVPLVGAQRTRRPAAAVAVLATKTAKTATKTTKRVTR
jgi:hypothetical protein